nr:hypothetical protein [Tanacetum cinerariifolium]
MALPDTHQLKFNIHKDAKSLIEAIEKRNKADLEDQSLDDFFNNLKIYEAEVKISVVPSVSAASIKVPAYAFPNVDNLSDAEMDLKWQMAMLTMRVRRSPKDTRNKDTQRRNVLVETSTSNALVSQCDGFGSYDWSFQVDEEPKNYALMAFTSSSSTSSSGSDSENENVFKEDIKLLKLDVMLRDNALVKLRKKFKKVEKERDELMLKLKKIQTFLKNLSKLIESQITDKTRLGYDNHVFNSIAFDCDGLISFESDKSVPTSPVHDRYMSGERYHAVPPPYTGTFMPPKRDLVFHDASTVSETVPTVSDSVNESEGEPMPTQKEPSFVQPYEHVKTHRISVKP